MLAATSAGHLLDGDRGLASAEERAVVVQLRIWQRLDRHDELWLSTRLAGGSWGETVRLQQEEAVLGYSQASKHRTSEISMHGVGLRIWQRVFGSDLVWVEACQTSPCRRDSRSPGWVPLGKVSVPLNEGVGPFAEYRYGDVQIAVPLNNAGLLADREYLLALRDVFAADPPLNWSEATLTTEWEGVSVSGTPPRVTGLALTNRGLTGEIWGYLGELTQLAELRLEDNRLSGMIPSKLAQLSNLTDVRFAGNTFSGCMPSSLLRVERHDLDEVGLAECSAPTALTGSSAESPHGGPASYVVEAEDQSVARGFAVDVPGGRTIRIELWEGDTACGPAQGGVFQSVWEAANCSQIGGYALRDGADEQIWLFVDFRGQREYERSRYFGCVYDCVGLPSAAALIEQVAASLWVNPARSEGEWSWP